MTRSRLLRHARWTAVAGVVSVVWTSAAWVPIAAAAAPARRGVAPGRLPALVSEAPARAAAADPGDFTDPPPAGAPAPAPAAEAAAPDREPRAHLGRPRLVGRTSHSDVYANPDGTETAVIGAERRNVRAADGTWQPIDPAVRGDGRGGHVTGAHPLAPRFAGHADAPDLFTVTADGRSATFSLPGAASAPAVAAGNGVRYRDVAPHTDLEYDVSTAGVKETLVLRRAPARGEAGYAFRLRTDGLEPVSEDDGAITLRDSAGRVRATIPPARAWDSAGRAGTRAPAEAPVAMTLRRSGDAWTVTLRPDAAWLADPARVYPVSVDPSVTYSNDIEKAYKSDGYTCTGCGVRIGNSRTGNLDTYYRSTIHFPYENLFGKQVLGASMRFTLCSTCGTANSYAAAVAIANSLTYGGYGTTQANGNIDNDTTFTDSRLTNTLITWVNNSDSSNYFHVRGQETAGTFTYKELNASLTITYNNKPGSYALVSPSNAAPKASITPTLKATATDADGDALSYYFRVGSPSNPDTSTVWNSGWVSTNTVTVPAGELAANTQYGWRMYAKDAHGTTSNPSQTNSATWTFTTNTPPPAASATNASPKTGTIATTKPQLSVDAVTDANGDTVRYWFRVATGSDGQTGQVVNSGWRTTPSWEVPAGSLVDGGSYSWTVLTNDSVDTTTATWAQSMDVDLRIGDHGPSPVDEYGPVTVNLANGNVRYTTSSRSLPTVGGPLGVTYSYNSQDEVERGLVASYYDGAGGTTHEILPTDEPTLVTSVPNIDFNWGDGVSTGTGSPYPAAMGNDNWRARWTGYLTAPKTGTYVFGATHDDGVRVTVNDTVVLDRYFNGAYTAVQYGTTSLALTGGVTVPVSVEYYDVGQTAFVSLYAKTTDNTTVPSTIVPTSWLTPNRPQPLATGWTMSVALDREAGYVSAKMVGADAVLVDVSGGSHTYTRASTTGSWTPPEGEDGTLTTDSAGLLVLHEDGTTYTFDKYGNLTGATDAADDVRRASPVYTYGSDGNGNHGRLVSVADPLSSRALTFAYGGDSSCAAAGNGFIAAPDALLCRIGYWDGTATDLRYVSNGAGGGYLARIEDPGGQVTDFAYNSSGKLAKIRDSLAADWVAADPTVRDTDEARTLITYQTLTSTAGTYRPPIGTHSPMVISSSYAKDGVLSVKLPVPLPDPNVTTPVRPQHTYDYVATLITEVDVAGLSPSTGYARRVTFDGDGRLLTDKDSTGAQSTAVWDSADRLLSTKDAAGRMKTALYDAEGRVTDEYGPAPEACFGTDRAPAVPLPSTCEPVPHNSVSYDTGIAGLAATYWANQTMSGAPALHATGVGHSTGALDVYWNTAGPTGLVNSSNVAVVDAFSARFTGEVTFPASGTYTFSVSSDDGVRVYVDDTLVIDSWTNGSVSSVRPTGTYVSPAAGTTRRIRVDYYEATGYSGITLKWTPPGSGTAVTVPGTSLNPRYGLRTGTTTEGSGDRPTQTVSYGFTKPETGLETSVTTDPGGLALTTSTTYESTSTSGTYQRALTRTSPAGGVTTYAYYGATETRTVPCTGGASSVPQGGHLKSVTEPTDSGSVARVTETVYDAAGRIAATRVNSEDWTCLTYDSRGRIATRETPASGGHAARTVTFAYSVSGDPLKTTVSDAAGTITEEHDLLGRVTAYTDVHGVKTVTTYRQDGLPASTATTLGTLSVSSSAAGYDSAGRLVSAAADGEVVAQVAYDTNNEVSSVTYPATGTDATLSLPNGGNGSSLSSLALDQAGRLTSLTWTFSDAATVANTLTRARPGAVLSSSVSVSGTTAGTSSYEYDAAGRLVQAAVPGHVLDYGFAASGGCGAATAAGKNTNRTSLTDAYTPPGGSTTTTTTSYCYDAADRLTSYTVGSDPAVTPSYDAHGNTTAYADQEIAYDPADRHSSTVVKAGGNTVHTVAYARDAVDRIVTRTSTPAGGSAATLKYAYTGADSGPAVLLNASDQVVERSFDLPGGVTLTKTSNAERWAYPNVHGDVIATSDATGVRQGSIAWYDPFGQPLDPTTFAIAPDAVPDTRDGAADDAWLGGNRVTYEHESTIATIEMGARQYVPGLGRFLSVDPVPGGNANAYEYCFADPVNCTDITGRLSNNDSDGTWTREEVQAFWRHVRKVMNKLHCTGGRGCKKKMRLYHYVYWWAMTKWAAMQFDRAMYYGSNDLEVWYSRWRNYYREATRAAMAVGGDIYKKMMKLGFKAYGIKLYAI